MEIRYFLRNVKQFQKLICFLVDEFSELVHPIISLGCQHLNYTLFDQTAGHDLEGTKCPAVKNIHGHLAFLRSFSVAFL